MPLVFLEYLTDWNTCLAALVLTYFHFYKEKYTKINLNTIFPWEIFSESFTVYEYEDRPNQITIWSISCAFLLQLLFEFIQEAATLELLYKKEFLKNFGHFTGKHLCWSFFLIKLQA